MSVSEDDEIIREFLVECNEHLDVLDNRLVAIEQNPKDKEILLTVFRSIHTIKGVSGMLAFDKLEKLTHCAESLLSLFRNGTLQLSTPAITGLLKTVDAVRHMLHSIAENGSDGTEDYNELMAELQRLQKVKTRPNRSKKSVQVNEDLNSFEDELVDEDSIVHEEEGSSLDSCQQKQSACELKPSSLIAETSIRLQVELLDKLMNLVGELVLSRNQIVQFNSKQKDSNFIAVSQRLNLITSELQEGVMKTRMQPIGTVWGKFGRVVRDLALCCHKQVDLQLFGSETELDKTLIEAIKDPLIHLVRNAVDHGIEPTEIRRRNGKNEQGTITLKAYHEGGHVHIEIHDDGAGISVDKIKKKAIERGLISSEQAMLMPERDAFNLIFLPGFSTAEQVTKVSGRGVGMDVVHTNIERINGTIDIISKSGQYTLMKIKIPLTLAIIPALIITCHQHRYAIPQISLVELVHIEPEELNHHVKYMIMSFIIDTPIHR
jgi:two-component system chemotaxis sensor kinase CheA